MTAPILTERSVRGMFYERLTQDTGASWVTGVAGPALDSDQDSENYPWVGMVPQLSEFRGQKKFSQLRTTPWIINNVEYQSGIAIPKKHILYDKTGQVMVRVNELSDRTLSHWIKLVSALIVAGESTDCYDGQYFFDTDHSEGDSGTQSNDVDADISTYPVSVSGTTTVPSAEEMVYAIMASIQALIAFKDDQGEYVNENQTEFLILAGPSFMSPILGALSKMQVGAGESNVIMTQDNFTIRAQFSPRFSAWTTKFATFAMGGNQSAIIRQQRLPNNAAPGYNMDGIQYSSLWLDSEHCIKNNECLVSVETERAAGYGDWKKAILTTLV